MAIPFTALTVVVPYSVALLLVTNSVTGAVEVVTMFPLASSIFTAGWTGKANPAVAPASSVAKTSFIVSLDDPPVSKGGFAGVDDNPGGVGEPIFIPLLLILKGTRIAVSVSATARVINKYFLFVDT